METLIYILSTILLLLFIVLFAIGKYRAYVFNKKTYSELVSMLRESRKTYNRLSYENRNSTYGILLNKSILAIEYRINELDNA